ncbi:MAG: c-type cytochrome [Gemmataceae bacterium]
MPSFVTNFLRCALCTLLACGFFNLARAADPELKGAVVGWDRHDGRVLLGELNCVACHAPGTASTRLLPKPSPLLHDVGGRVTPQYLQAFLSKPHETKAGTPMPDLLASLKPDERQAAVDNLVHYLVSLGGPIDQRSSGASTSQIERGKDLYHSMGCVACHAPIEAPPKHKIDPSNPVDDDPDAKPKAVNRASIPHGDLAMKTTVRELAQFLMDPLKTRPAGRMPGFNLSPSDANFLAAYLLRDQYSEKEKAPGVGLDIAYFEGNWPKVPDFEKLKPVYSGSAKGFEIATLEQAIKKKLNSNFAIRYQGLIDIPETGRYKFWTRSDDGTLLKIDGKLIVNNDGMHPPQEKGGDVTLRQGRHAIELGFVQGGGGHEMAVFWQPPNGKREPVPAGILFNQSAGAMIPKGIITFNVDPTKAEKGKQLFSTLGCANCHSVDPSGKIAGNIKAKELTALDPASAQGCLADKPVAGRPVFDLDPKQRAALRQSVADLKKPLEQKPEDQIAHLMSSMSCYRCHGRNEKGGPDPDRAAYFTYQVLVDLGDEGRLPPPLTDVGAKITPEGFDDVFIKGGPYRTYMATRMPLFGKANVGHLPGLLAQADAGKIKPHKPSFSSRLVDDGRRLVGNKALSCINCHAWGQYRVQGAEGLDFLQATRRLRPEWFHAFLLDPQKLKPRTRMPNAWPDGKSFFPDIQGGSTDKQIDAIWAYLAVKEKGGIPPGISTTDDFLVPTDETIVFRTFVDGVSAHGITVGFRQRTAMVFDANRVRSVAAWSGDYISTKPAWEGRAGLYAKIPSAAVVRFPDGPTFAKLASENDPWPTDPPKQRLGSNRTPEGFKYKGYRLDEKRDPTFLYRFDNIDVEESPTSDYKQNVAYLARKFNLKAAGEVKNVYMRVATGKKITEKDGAFVIDDKETFKILGAKPIVREVKGGQELLVPVELKNGAGTLTVETTW